MNNQAFIDGQNLYVNTIEHGWKIDLKRFRIYLKQKYSVEKAYYFLGATNEENQDVYDLIQESGFILRFREHNRKMHGKKKGNVDTDIVFSIMSKIANKEKFNQVILVSGDGDYYKMVRYLVGKEKFCKLLSPNRQSTSSLYQQFTPKYVDFLDNEGVRNKIAYKKRST